MVTVAVTGVSTPLGQALLDRLDGDPDIDRIIGIDRAWPTAPPVKLDMRILPPLADGDRVAAGRAGTSQTDGSDDARLTALLAEADAVVNLATEQAGPRGPSVAARTRALLRAARGVGVRTVVQLSSAMVYGAHPDNPVPLSESAPLRAHPLFAPGYQPLLGERIADEFAAAHPDVRVVKLRPAPMLGSGAETPLRRHLESPLLTAVADHDPPLQFCDVRDLAHAVHMAVRPGSGMRGAYNVASDGWLTAAEASRLLGRPRLHLPEAVAETLADLLARLELLESGQPWVHYLMHPFVVDTRALRRAGWSATRSNRDIVRQFGRQQRDVWRIGPLRLSRRRLAAGAGAATTVAALLTAAGMWYGYRRWRARA